MTSRQLANVNVGSWFNRAHPALAREEYEQQRVPTLADVFQFLRDKPGIIYVELKTDGADSSSDLVRAVADAIVQFGFQERVVVVSFELPAVAAIKSLNSSIRTGALFAPQRRPNVSWRADSILNAATECGADELLPHRLLARPKLLEKARDRHLPVVVWTVDDQAWVARAKTLGIHALITNNPARCCSCSGTAGSFRGRTCPAIERRTSAASKRRLGRYPASKHNAHVRIAHVSCIIVGLVIRPKYPEVNS